MHADKWIPEDKLFFSLTEIAKTGLMSREQAKIKVSRGEITGVKNGKKWVVPRSELIRFIEDNLGRAAKPA